MLPLETPRELTRLIQECWATDRIVRPDFVDVCTRLANLRHELLRGDPHSNGSKDETDGFANLYIQEMIKKQSNACNQECSYVQSQLLENVTEEEEWSVPDQVRPCKICNLIYL